jgi:L-lactate dehydrogenase complex protein LldF
VAQPVQRVAFFSGCTIDFVFPETGESVFKVLQDLSLEVVFPEKQSCCGKPVSAVGDVETARRIARQNIEAFEAAAPDVIVAACPACVEALRGYAELLKEEEAWGARAERISQRVAEFCSFVAKEYERTGRLRPATVKGKITYHDSCHMKRVLGISQERGAATRLSLFRPPFFPNYA